MSTQSSVFEETRMPIGNTLGSARIGMNVMSLSVRLPLHTGIGPDEATKLKLGLMTALMMVGSYLGNLHFGFGLFSGFQVFHGDDNSLFYYALFALALGFWQRWDWFRKEKLGEEGHSFSLGDGRLYGFIPLERKYIDLAVEPLLVLIAGAVCRYRLGFGLLGLWLMVSAVMLGITEKLWQVKLDRLIRQNNNNDKEARWLAEYARTRPKGAAAKSGVASSVTIPTGSDDALEALIEKNKQENGLVN